MSAHAIQIERCPRCGDWMTVVHTTELGEEVTECLPCLEMDDIYLDEQRYMEEEYKRELFMDKYFDKAGV
jgi:hypothetical protein